MQKQAFGNTLVKYSIIYSLMHAKRDKISLLLAVGRK